MNNTTTPEPYVYAPTSAKFTSEELDAIAQIIQKIELGQVFSLNTDGEVRQLTDVRAPDVTFVGEEFEVLVDGHEGESAQWCPIPRLSNQDHYAGPILHPSENMSRGIVRVMLDHLDDEAGPGTRPNCVGQFAMCVVEEMTDETERDGSPELVGWVIVERDMEMVHLLDEAERFMRHDRVVEVTLVTGKTYRGTVVRVDDEGFTLQVEPTTQDRIYLFVSSVAKIEAV